MPVDLLEDGDGCRLGRGRLLALRRRCVVAAGRRAVNRSLLLLRLVLVVGVHFAVDVIAVLALVPLSRGQRRQEQRQRELWDEVLLSL